MSEVWFAIPSASVERCRERLPVWRERGYRIAVLQNQERGEIPADVVVWSDTYPGWAESVNILCREIVPASADLMVSGGDDMLPEPSKTAAEMASEYFERFPDGFGVMQPCGDPHMNAREYCGSPWFGRGWIERAYGGRGPMWCGYRHNWADHELHWVARALEALWERPDITQRHEHFTREGEVPPPWWDREVGGFDRSDVELFIGRLWQGFPGHEPRGAAGADSVWWRDAYPGTALAYWGARYGQTALGGEASLLMERALETCAKRGWSRVGIFGAGTQTRGAAAALMDPPVEIVCLFDEDPKHVGGRLWGYPIERPERAAVLGLDAIVLSSRAMLDVMVERTAPLRRDGVACVRPGGEVIEEVVHV